MKPILIHTHFHKRRTGVTRSIENVAPYFDKSFELYIYGNKVKGLKISTLRLVYIFFSNKKLVVHCHRNNELIRMLFFRFFGAKFTLIATRHAETPPSKFTLNLLKKADKTVTLTKSMSKSLAIKNIIIGHGVNVDLFIPKSQSTLSSISQKNIILCAGRVRASKGQETLLEAAKVLKENKNWALVLVGKVEKPSFLQKLQTIAEKYFIENQVYFVNETLDISSYYQAAKVVVVPSFSEGFSLVAAEAMSCECSVIATQKVGVHSLLIKHGKNGYLFEAGNVVQLEKLILGVIKDENLFLGKEARKEITKNWSSKTEANKLIELYQE